MSTLLTNVYFLPDLRFFVRVMHFSHLMLEVNENFQKRSPRNRCYILNDRGLQRITVPVVKANSTQPIREVRIENTSWSKKAARMISTAYGKAPFFDHYFPLIEQILAKEHTYLWELNTGLIMTCLKLTGWKGEVGYTTSFNKEWSAEITDRRDMKPDYDEIRPEPYVHVFHDAFEPAVSIIDLLFCEGPATGSILRDSLFRMR